MLSQEISKRWIDFFASRGHTVVPSASLISNEPGAMFTIAGMVPFIPYFLGRETPPFSRATSVQKCIRTLDIEEVGKTARHGTFFQMAGNFSFGDYFKEQAIPFAYELLTTPQDKGGFGLDPERLWVTIYEGDDEAFDIWHNKVGFPAERIQRMGMKENYWSTGQPGPAGPDSEIFYDRGPAYGKEGGPAADDDRYIEIWNLVFMQYQRGEGIGKDDFEILGDLPKKNIDTGLGVERLAMLLQGVENFYETDQVRPVLDAASKLSGKKYHGSESAEDEGYEDDVRMRVVADHIRSSLMLIADGVTPSNEGRGYILRRLMRRAIRAMRLLGVTEPCLPVLFPASRDAMKGAFPYVADDFERISRIAYAEEKAFLHTIETGTERLEEAVAAAKKDGSNAVSGAEAFALHDTYGFPIDLTLEMAAEAGVKVDEKSFRELMAEQRHRAQADAKAKKGAFADLSELRKLVDERGSIFTGYTELRTETKLRAILVDGVSVPAAKAGDKIEVVLDETPFYAEAGGQAADTGVITGNGFVIDVQDVQQPVKGLSVHRAVVREGEVHTGADVVAQVDVQRRRDGEKAHSGTHIIHAALHQVLGNEATQRGSFNKEGYLRFDFAWSEGLSESAKREVEEVANLAIRDNHEVITREMPLAEAKALGAMSLFGEKYGDVVRVVEIGGEFSRELCGGTHVGSSAEIGSLTLLTEGSVGSGNRRVEALVGLDSFNHLAAERTLVNQLTGLMKVQSSADLPEKINQTLAKLKAAEKELAQLRREKLQAEAGKLLENAQTIGSVRVLAHDAGELDANGVRDLALDLRSRFGSEAAVVAVVGVANGRPVVLVATNEGAREAGVKAGALVRVAAGVLGGGGGGKDDVAQGGGQDASKVGAALDAVRDAIAQAQA
ncbi:alanine--tRNA ligase [Rothia sp. HMSC066H02]|uniref:alanine--tRNA ligase n=1 Tax=unclassified Rothia (in: high G+C Gram-positive bacteria) TaxID=2689056 RepID=UPI0008A3FA56|nr:MULTISPECIES: alanine--tRNA ligase [unclassified Rothia (in: high G+C Gram-positive bacteria)]OFO97263.1 alanine--tRNA ligase [Rothia sp. HMSC065D09]OFP13293.1 alanine--tRNA ligase [Rothia sp. HMSC066H02]